MKNFKIIAITTTSIFFGLFGLMYMLFATSIGEADDVFIIQILGIPSIFLSLFFASFLLKFNNMKIFLSVIIVNFVSIIFALISGYSGIVDIISFQNNEYFGHQNNNYHSIDLFIIAIAPLIIFVMNLAYYCYIKAHNK